MVLRVEHRPNEEVAMLRPGSDGLFQVTFFDTIFLGCSTVTSKKDINVEYVLSLFC